MSVCVLTKLVLQMFRQISANLASTVARIHGLVTERKATNAVCQCTGVQSFAMPVIFGLKQRTNPSPG